MPVFFRFLFPVLSLFFLSAHPDPRSGPDSGILSGFLDKAASSLGRDKQKWITNSQLRVIYVQVDRYKGNVPTLTYHQFGYDGKEYFSPASLVKLPVSLLALERINRLRRESAPWLRRDSRLEIISAGECQVTISEDSNAVEGYPNIAQYIRRILTVSDNPSYNRVFDFLGQQVIRDELNRKGYGNARITTRFSDCSPYQNRFAPYFRFYDVDLSNILHQPASFNPDSSWIYMPGRTSGNAYMEGGKIIRKPKDFGWSNEVSLLDELDMLIRFVLPETRAKHQQWDLSPDDRAFLFRYLSTAPNQSGLLEYADTTRFPKFLKKYFLRNASSDHQQNDSLKVFNIVGLAYGFVSDVSYVVDLRTRTEFFLATTMVANQNGVIGDGRYDYETEAFPLYGKLFDLVFEYERNRKRGYVSDFREIREALAQPMK